MIRQSGRDIALLLRVTVLMVKVEVGDSAVSLLNIKVIVDPRILVVKEQKWESTKRLSTNLLKESWKGLEGNNENRIDKECGMYKELKGRKHPKQHREISNLTLYKWYKRWEDEKSCLKCWHQTGKCKVYRRVAGVSGRQLVVTYKVVGVNVVKSRAKAIIRTVWFTVA